MKKSQALDLLTHASKDGKPSQLDKSLSRKDVQELVKLNVLHFQHEELHESLVERVWQCFLDVKNLKE